MGKRNVVVISSSSSEEDDNEGGCKRMKSIATNRISSSKSNPIGLIHPNSTLRSSKRARRRLSDSQFGCQQKLDLGNFDALCDDFYDGFQECKKVTGSSGMKDKGGQWVEKYRPQSLADLAVHKKKVFFSNNSSGGTQKRAALLTSSLPIPELGETESQLPVKTIKESANIFNIDSATIRACQASLKDFSDPN